MGIIEAKVSETSKKTIVFNSKVRTFASILRVVAILPLYLHIFVNKDSEESFLGWYNFYSFMAYFETYFCLLIVLITIPLQAYVVSTIPILFVVVYSLIEFFIDEKNLTLILINLGFAFLVTFLIVKSWQALSQSKILESKVSRQILEKLTEQREEVKINLHEKPENSIIS